MQYLSHFIHAFLMFVTPLSFIGYKTTNQQKFIFTLLYGLGVVFCRMIYKFHPVPFGTHSIMLVILSIILFKNIVRDYTWKDSIYTALILFIALLINDSIIVLPMLHLLNLSIETISDNIFLWVVLTIVSNFTFIACLILGFFKNKNKIFLNSGGSNYIE